MKIEAIVLLVLCGMPMVNASPGSPLLNEVMADNRGAVANGEDFPDYVELVNLSTAAVSLTGASLSDDPANPRRFVFPSNISIPANGYLVVWCDNSTTAPGLHTGFALGAKGEQLRLYAADGSTVWDEVTFGLQLPSLSIGRIPNGSATWALTTPTPGTANRAQASGGPSQLRINEWMARPAAGEDWIELFNTDTLPVALSRMILTDSTEPLPQNRPIPALSFIAGRGFVQLFASDLEQTDADHLDFRLGSSGETLTLLDTDRQTTLDRVTFGDQTADVSQGRAPDGSDNIVFLPLGAATPGEPNFAEITNVVISEVLSHSDPPFEDAIELQNVSNSAVDISHWWLSDSASEPRKYRIPAGTTVAPSGFVVFYEYQFASGPSGFSLDSAEGDEVFLSAGDASGRLTGQQTFVEFGPLRNGVSVGRFETSVGIDFVPLDRLTFGVDDPSTVERFRRGTGQANAAPRIGPVVITEFECGPAGADNAGNRQYIELHNPTSAPVPLYDPLFPTNTWRLRDAVTFDLPINLTLPSGGYLLIVDFDPALDPAAATDFRTRFSVPASVPLFGPFDGRLSSSGEEIELRRPDEPEGPDDPNAGLVPYELVERIAYSTSAPWPAFEPGTGRTLQRRNPLAYGNEPGNWQLASPSPGKPAGAASSDSDGDGMPDDWENAHGLSPSSPDDAALDPDNDALTNLEEFVAGTDPRDPQSTFRITSLEVRAGEMLLVFPGVQGKGYALQSSGGIPDGRWLTVTNLVAAVTGPVELRLPLPAPSIPAAWYRLSIPTSP